MKTLCVFLIVFVGVFGDDGAIPNSVINTNRKFGVDLYGEIRKTTDGNFVQSPLSLTTILALISLGAKGETADQIKSTLKLTIPNDQIKTDFKTLTHHLKNTTRVTIATANKAYLAKNLKIEPEFRNTAVDYFGSDVENVDFATPKEAAAKINSWVEEETDHKIKELIEGDKLTEFTRLVLVNTLYFKGRWYDPFGTDYTQKKDFHLSKKEVVQVDTMSLTEDLIIHRDQSKGVTILQLPYLDTKANLLIGVPDEIDGLADAEKNFWSIVDKESFTTTEYLTVSLPKFKVESTFDMIPILKKMGITNLFSKADLTGLSKENLFVSSVTQKVYIDVDEEGTEAASATAAEIMLGSAWHPPREPKEFKIDRPFMFCLQYDGLYLMSGRVVNPQV